MLLTTINFGSVCFIWFNDIRQAYILIKFIINLQTEDVKFFHSINTKSGIIINKC